MKCLMTICLIAIISQVGMAGSDFYAATNQIGYTGTIYNMTDDPQGNNPWTFPTPRDGVINVLRNFPGYDNWNAIQSNWYQHPTSNQNPGFFQINDGGTVTSATASWTYNGSSWDFTCTVTGQNATYANSTSRLWQPDINNAAGGTYTEYTYMLTATGMTTAVDATYGRYNTSSPVDITGTFDATFLLTYAGDAAPDGRPEGTEGGGPWEYYSVHLDFDNDLWDGTKWSDTYGGYTYGQYSDFYVIPEPATMVLLGLGGLLVRKFRKA
jgi:hypothetical protein